MGLRFRNMNGRLESYCLTCAEHAQHSMAVIMLPLHINTYRIAHMWTHAYMAIDIDASISDLTCAACTNIVQCNHRIYQRSPCSAILAVRPRIVLHIQIKSPEKKTHIAVSQATSEGPST